MNKYNKEFYQVILKGSESSAGRIVPYIMDMLAPVSITSVIDFGCGVGGWLSEFQKVNSSIKVLGLDFGNPDESQLQIDLDSYKKVDLSKKIYMNRKFDLCISLEVAEHIDSGCADVFVDNLCRHGDFILFSAAIPGQGGTGHVNEQPLSYWVKKFKQRNYEPYDIIRPYFWNDKDVEVWYRQNIVLFVKNGTDIENCNFKKESFESLLDIAHPDLVCILEKLRNEKFLNWHYLYIHNRKLFNFLRRIKHIFVS